MQSQRLRVIEILKLHKRKSIGGFAVETEDNVSRTSVITLFVLQSPISAR
jgi:hypothetical protein